MYAQCTKDDHGKFSVVGAKGPSSIHDPALFTAFYTSSWKHTELLYM